MKTNESSETKPKTLKEFRSFMSLNATGWVLINNTESMVSYQRNTEEKKGSCFLTILLLLLGIIPGLLYIYFSHRSASTAQLTVLRDEDGDLSASGDNDGLRLFNKFMGFNSAGVSGWLIYQAWLEKNSVVIVCVVLAIFALYIFSKLSQ